MGRKMHASLMTGTATSSSPFTSSTNKLFGTSNTHTIDGVKVEGNVKPLRDNIFVKVKNGPSKTASGLYLPDTATKGKPLEGIVMTVGTGRIHPDTGVTMKMPVSVGDHVVYSRHDIVEVKYDDMPHQIFSADNVVLKYTVAAGNEEEQQHRELADVSVEDLQCTGSQVLIELPPENGKTASGVIVASAQTLPDHGTVVKVGPGAQTANGDVLPMPVAVGDLVQFKEYNMGMKVKIQGKHYLVVDSSEILAKLLPDA